MDLTDSDFQETLDSKEWALVDFWAPWCGPCRVLEPILKEVSSELEIPLYKLLVDDNPKSAASFGVQGIPTVIVFRGGKEAGRLVGAMPKNKLLSEIKEIIS